jgi:GTP cyclohydrolase II
MELLKKYRLVIIVVLPILILVLIRSSGLNYFKNDAKKRAEPSLKQSNIMIIEQAGSLSGKNLIINLDKEGKLTGDVQNIPADSVLTKNYVTMIMKHDGPVLLFSLDPGLSARIWMILSQLGCRNIYILTNSSDNEVFKYKFRPDTLLN